jgi:hypothetical protein
VLATRGITPCVRFYRGADGTVMTTDCPTGTRREDEWSATLGIELEPIGALGYLLGFGSRR